MTPSTMKIAERTMPIIASWVEAPTRSDSFLPRIPQTRPPVEKRSKLEQRDFYLRYEARTHRWAPRERRGPGGFLATIPRRTRLATTRAVAWSLR